ncbi:MAG: hypothetical protein FJ271_04830 [Planctomycetes bacterium]|nr:hypothetical protein [Planctomycetota bacterium]
MRHLTPILVTFLLPSPLLAQSKDGNRLAYLDAVNPYYPSRTFPKLITPQWVGDKGVEAVVILGIDDMRESKRYEAFLRPILRRLKKIDGRAPVSIMANKVDPADPQLQTWLKEGLSIECHTLDHPCPFFAKGFAKAKATYDGCVDLMAKIPNSKPVAFRMPCCDSLNTPSPRFYAEIFNKTTAKGNFLTIDSSVFNVFTANDKELPRELVLLPDGTERFRRYLPKDRSFVNTIEDYPYPYVIGRLCWQFPCVTPSDWQAQHFHKPNNPETVRDWKAALDCTVIKQGVMCLVFHPHGWCKSDQIIELIDHAVAKHGKKVKFLTFKEAQERLNKEFLDGWPIRNAKTGADNHVQVACLANQGFIGALFKRRLIEGREYTRRRTWAAEPDGGGNHWRVVSIENIKNLGGINTPFDRFERFRELDLGEPDIYMAGDDKEEKLFRFNLDKLESENLRFSLPRGAKYGSRSKDHGLRFLDLDGDGKLDIIFSNEKEFGIYLFKDMKSGWSRKVLAGKRGDADALPMISRNGTNNGFWVHSGQLWWSNEDTVNLKDHVDRRSIKELLKKAPK